jgi:3-hydroxy acid dehydrogenase/malonic semialdehyde reductase
MAGIFSTSRLFNKTALITGASGGIGAATAILFARAGANVIISARRKDQLSKVAEEARKANKEGQTGQGGKVFELVLDVSDRRSADGELKRSRPEGLLNMHS